jgi:hypothetical protein
VSQLAPQPGFTRQCAFDLRDGLEIVAAPPDGARPHPTSFRADFVLAFVPRSFIPILAAARRPGNWPKG